MTRRNVVKLRRAEADVRVIGAAEHFAACSPSWAMKFECSESAAPVRHP
jgi:hypothetical protein